MCRTEIEKLQGFDVYIPMRYIAQLKPYTGESFDGPIDKAP